MGTIYRAFSLVELMVVIAIIGILSAIAVPSYRSYIIKSKIASGMPILANALNKVIEGYDTTGSFPNPLQLYGVFLPANPGMGALATLNAPPVVGIHYNVGNTSGAVWICIYYADIGLPGFVAWNGSGPNSGVNSRLCMLAAPDNGIYKKYCGYFNGYSTDIALTSPQYAPSNCNVDLSIYNH